MNCSLPGLLSWDSPGKNTGVGCHALFQGILTNIMFDIPSDPSVKKVTITPECVRGEQGPDILRADDAEENNGAAC